MEIEKMLEMSAKAVGAQDYKFVAPGPTWDQDDYGSYADFGEGFVPWYPLSDWRDAMYLAKKLYMIVDFQGNTVGYNHPVLGPVEIYAKFDGIQRIVEAAAEIQAYSV